MSAEDDRERLMGELSDLALRIYKSGGPGGLAEGTVAMAKFAAAAMPVEAIPHFVRRLLEAVASGARTQGHEVVLVDTSQEMQASGAVH